MNCNWVWKEPYDFKKGQLKGTRKATEVLCKSQRVCVNCRGSYKSQRVCKLKKNCGEQRNNKSIKEVKIWERDIRERVMHIAERKNTAHGKKGMKEKGETYGRQWSWEVILVMHGKAREFPVLCPNQLHPPQEPQV